ncbi:MAG: hypothetical protein Phog2KO_47470 [Phototrophicaceae bacterium]
MSNAVALIIEDNTDNIEMYGILMHIEKYSVSSVQDGEQALDWLNTNDAPAILLLDINMPRVDGRQVYDYVRNNTKFSDTRIIIITANSYMAKSMSSILHKRDYLLQKPFKMIDLQKIVRDMRKARQQ